MKVRSSVTECLTYSGTLDLGGEEYNDLSASGEDSPGEILLDMIDRDNPGGLYVEGVDGFESVGE